MKSIIYFIVIIAFLDTFSQLPIIAPYALSLGATSMLVGLAVGMYSLSNMFGNVVAGEWIDRIGPKKILWIGMSLTGVIVLSYVFVQTATQLVIVRFIHGLSGGFLVPAAFTFLSNGTEKGKQGKSMALSGAGVGLAAIIGPSFGGIVQSKYGVEWVFITISSLLFIGALLSFFFLPNTKVEKESVSTDKGGYLPLLQKKSLLQAYTGAFALMFAQGIIVYSLSTKVKEMGYSSAMSGRLMSIFGIVAIIIFLLPINKMFDKLKLHRIILVGITVMASALCLLSIFDTINLLMLAMVVYGVGYALLFPSITTVIANETTPDNRGKAFGIFYAVFSLGVVDGSFIVGAIDVTTNGSFLVGALGMIIVGSFIYFLRGDGK